MQELKFDDMGRRQVELEERFVLQKGIIHPFNKLYVWSQLPCIPLQALSAALLTPSVGCEEQILLQMCAAAGMAASCSCSVSLQLCTSCSIHPVTPFACCCVQVQGLVVAYHRCCSCDGLVDTLHHSLPTML